jgi:hypothetical protein
MTDLESINQCYRDLAPEVKRNYSIEQYYAEIEELLRTTIFPDHNPFNDHDRIRERENSSNSTEISMSSTRENWLASMRLHNELLKLRRKVNVGTSTIPL